MDFLATYAAEHIDGGLIARELETILGCQVSLDKGLEGKETKANAGSQGTYTLLWWRTTYERRVSAVNGYHIIMVFFNFRQ